MWTKQMDPRLAGHTEPFVKVSEANETGQVLGLEELLDPRHSLCHFILHRNKAARPLYSAS